MIPSLGGVPIVVNIVTFGLGGGETAAREVVVCVSAEADNPAITAEAAENLCLTIEADEC